MKTRKVQRLLLVLLMVWYGWFFFKRIDLTTADLGRHIKNGQMILQGNWQVLRTNFYSYTEPNFPVVNHHWGAGVIFYLIYQIFGMVGLSLFYLVLSLVVFYLFFKVAQKEAGFNLSLIISAWLIPLMAARVEIRPEIFSYLFIALFFLILQKWRKGELDSKWLFVLPLCQVVWVNTHIYFVFGLALVGLYWVDKMIREKRFDKELGLILGLVGLASLLSPFGLKGLVYPFNIFRNYGYDIVENKSVLFLENWGFNDPNLKLFEISLVILILSFGILFFKNRKRFPFIYFVLAFIWGGLGFMAIRNFSLFAFFSLVILGYNLRYSKLGVNKNLGLVPSVLVVVFILANSLYFYYPKLPWGRSFGWGLMEGNNKSVEFFKSLKLKGPIFNNYDLGGYLIYNFYPEERVFTDNRPEAYSISHFKDVYIPAQNEEGVWKELDNKYDFNVIYFSHRDYTPWGQKFLIDRVKDDDWAVIYYDSYAIILLKRNDLNKEAIKLYEVPKEVFGLGR